jgi:putative component of toxin-antitoxin plasmid stabilization module
MKAYIRKFSNIKKRKFSKKLLGLGCLGFSLKFGDINLNPDYYLLTLVNSQQETQSLLETNNQSIENNCNRVKTGSRTVMEIKTLVQTSKNDLNSRVILVKIGDSGPSVPISPGRGQPSSFPTPPSGGRPVYVPKYRMAPKIVGPGLGAGVNPAGAGGGGKNPEFDDNCPVPDKEESKIFDYDYDPKNKKISKDQCELDQNVKAEKLEIVYRIKENPALVREAERAGRDQDAQRSLNNLIEQLSLGNPNPGIGTQNVFKDVFELRGKNRARVYYRKVDAKIEILAKSVKSNQQKVINILKKLYD